MRKATVLLTDGSRTVLTGGIVDQLYKYFSRPTGSQPSIGWVTSGDININFNHVMQVTFREVEDSGEDNAQ